LIVTPGRTHGESTQFGTNAETTLDGLSDGAGTNTYFGFWCMTFFPGSFPPTNIQLYGLRNYQTAQ